MTRNKSSTIIGIVSVGALLAGALWLSRSDPSEEASPGSEAEADTPAERVATPPAPPPRSIGAECIRHRILGTAYFENAQHFDQALEHFRACVELHPESAVDHLNVGLAHARAGETKEASAALERAARLDPELAAAPYNLGLIRATAGELDAAVSPLQRAVALAPDDDLAHLQLANLHRKLDRPDDSEAEARKALALNGANFQAHYLLSQLLRAKGAQEEAETHASAFERQRALRQARGEPDDPGVGPLAEPIVFDRDEAEAYPPAMRPEWTEVSPVALTEATPSTEPTGIRCLADHSLLVRFGDRSWHVAPGWLDEARPSPLPGDVVDAALVELGAAEPELVLLTSDGQLRRGDAAQPSAVTQPRALMPLDADWDGDVDIAVFGDTTALMQNLGDGRLAVREAPFASSMVMPAGPRPADFDGGRGPSLALWRSADGPSWELVSARPEANGESRLTSMGLPPRPGAAPPPTAAADFDHDGRTRLAVAHDGAIVVESKNGRRRLETKKAPHTLVEADFDLDGHADLAWDGPTIGYDGETGFESQSLGEGQRVAACDGDGDGDPDLASVSAGRLHLRRNEGVKGRGPLVVDLVPRDPAAARLGTRIELRSPGFHRVVYARGRRVVVPAGPRSRVDVVRVVWPNGLVQNEFDVALDRPITIEQTERMTGSCPSLFVHDGDRFRYLTDVFVSGPVGVPAAAPLPFKDGELLRLDGAVTSAGRIRVLITEELREVVYFDRAVAHVIDHPSTLEVMPDERLVFPPTPRTDPVFVTPIGPPLKAETAQGEDVSELLAARDHRYVVPPSLVSPRGFAAPHSVRLTIPPDADLLVLTGWFEYLDSGGVESARQRGLMLGVPILRRSAVTTVVGLPYGKDRPVLAAIPKGTAPLELQSGSAAYWDQALAVRVEPDAPHERHEASLASATLRFAGFHMLEERRPGQPERFDAQRTYASAPWEPVPGHYTRYGDVSELLGKRDDRLVVFGAGDGLTLEFDIGSTPPQEGWERTVMLELEGWVIDGELATAGAQQVEPLPYRGMAAYPPTRPGPARSELRSEWSTRAALQLHGSLARAEPERRVWIEPIGTPVDPEVSAELSTSIDSLATALRGRDRARLVAAFGKDFVGLAPCVRLAGSGSAPREDEGHRGCSSRVVGADSFAAAWIDQLDWLMQIDHVRVTRVEARREGEGTRAVVSWSMLLEGANAAGQPLVLETTANAEMREREGSWVLAKVADFETRAR